jgi:hypothetical protein
MNIKMTTTDRKALVTRLGELTEVKPHYNGMPSCSYTIGDYEVLKDGTITVEDEKADMEILSKLANDELIEAPVTAEEEQTAFPVKMNISLPIEGHTGSSIRNLINELYSRAGLINKAIGSNFSVPQSLTDELGQDENTETVEKALACIEALADEIDGIEFSDDKITFTGFREANNQEEVKAFTDLASLMTKAAKDQKRIMAKEVDETNEKYITRIWLLRLGMKGDGYRTTRKILLENLSGHVAFRTADQIEAAKEKAKAKRAAAKAAEVAAGGDNDEVSE